MSNRYITHTFTTASVSAGASSNNDRTGLPNFLNIVKLKVVPNSAGGTFDVKIFKKDTYLAADLLAWWDNVTPSLYDPMDDSTGSPAEALEGVPIPYDDSDATGELHIQVTNNDGGAHTYDVTIEYETGGAAVVATRVSSQFDKTNTTLADVTGLSVGVIAGRTYAFEAFLYTASDVGGGVKFSVSDGGSVVASAIIYDGIVFQGNVAGGHTRATALNTAVGAITTVTTAWAIITGTISVSTGGPLRIGFAENAAVATSSVLVGSTFTVRDIT